MNIFDAVPTILKLEEGVRYHAYFWEPSRGIKFDLGSVELPALGEPIKWGDHLVEKADLMLASDVSKADIVAAMNAQAGVDTGLVLRYQDADNYITALYSAKDEVIRGWVASRDVPSAHIAG